MQPPRRDVEPQNPGQAVVPETRVSDPEIQASDPGTRTSSPEVRASDRERDAATHQLQAAFAEGRLDDAEFDERMRAALTARTRGQLEQLLTDLPDFLPSAPGRSVAATVG